MTTEKKTTYRYMEYLRVLCAFAVILVHVSGMNWFKIPIGSRDWVIQAFYNIAGRFSVCVFCMLTGALFLAPGRDMSPENMKKHIGRILLILGIWTILYDILYTVMEDGDAEYFILHLVKLPGHLWYLLMLVSLYLSTPILKKVTEDRAVYLHIHAGDQSPDCAGFRWSICPLPGGNRKGAGYFPGSAGYGGGAQTRS